MEFTADNAHSILDKWVVGDPMALVFDLQHSHGAYLRDARSKQDYLDFFSFFAARPLSFAHPKMQDAAFVERLTAAAQVKPSNCDMYTVEYAQFAHAMAHTALGNHFAHLFFVEGGSPAVENALKAAMDWKHRKNIAAGRGEKGSQIIHFKQAFHGRTGYCLSITDSYDIRKTQYYPKFPWPRVTNPKMRFPFDAAAQAQTKQLEEQSLREIQDAFTQRQDDIAAIIIEPIQGEGGDNYFRSEFLQALRRVCDEHEALLIFDEVQTGFAATGAWWDWQHHNVKPDILVFGKKTQVCGIAATQRLDDVDSVFSVKSRISSTFNGGLVDMVRTARVIDIVQQDKLVDNARLMGNAMQAMLTELAGEFSSVTAVRGRGLWAAFDVPNTAERNRLVEHCFEEKLLILPSGTQSIRLRPALDISRDDIAVAATRLRAGLHKTFKK